MDTYEDIFEVLQNKIKIKELIIEAMNADRFAVSTLFYNIL